MKGGSVRRASTWLQPNRFAGSWWFLPNCGGSGTMTPVTDQAYLVALQPERDCTLAGIMAEITTPDATGVLRFGLASDVDGRPSAWLADYGTAVATAAVVVQPAVTPAVQLLGGSRYWLAVVPQGITAGLVLRSRQGQDPALPVAIGTPTSFGVSRSAWFAAPVPGALSGAITISAIGQGPALGALLN